MSGIASGNNEIASGHGSGNQEGASLDAIRDDPVFRAFQFAHAFDVDGGGSGAFDLCSHFVEQGGEVCNFGLASAVLQNGFALGESGGHEQIFSACDGDLVKNDFRTFETISGGFDVTVVLRDLCAELF